MAEVHGYMLSAQSDEKFLGVEWGEGGVNNFPGGAALCPLPSNHWLPLVTGLACMRVSTEIRSYVRCSLLSEHPPGSQSDG